MRMWTSKDVAIYLNRHQDTVIRYFRNYATRTRPYIEARKVGSRWLTTKAAVDRDLNLTDLMGEERGYGHEGQARDEEDLRGELSEGDAPPEGHADTDEAHRDPAHARGGVAA